MSKIFTRKWSEISGNNLIPEYYHPERLENIEKISNVGNYDKLKNIVNFNNKKIYSSACKYIGMANIESDTGIYIQNIEMDNIKEFNSFKKGQVLFGKLRPYLNKVYFTEFDGICSTEFIVMDSKDKNKLLNKYLSIFLLLKCVVNQTKYLMGGNTLPRISIFDIENLLIPIPTLNIQQNIIALMDNAYTLKKEKEDEAKRLLDSIDGYLLNALGIQVPAQDTTPKNRIFTRKFSEVSGDRFDASHNQEYYKKLEKSLYLSKYPLMKIKLLFVNINETKLCNNNDRLYIEIGDIDIITKEIMCTNKQKIVSSTIVLLENEDLLISTVRPTRGAIAIFNSDTKSCCSGAFCVLRHKKFSVVLLQYLLSSYIYKSLFEKYCSGSTYPTIKKDHILNLKIPVPSVEIQEKISNEILDRKTKALRLQKEARKLLEEAKYQVENIIFGERV